MSDLVIESLCHESKCSTVSESNASLSLALVPVFLFELLVADNNSEEMLFSHRIDYEV